MAREISEGVKALRAFVSDGGESPLRDGAREVMEENRRLRAIFAAMSKQGLGDAALVEITIPDEDSDGRVNVIVCCPSQDEVALGAVVSRALVDIFAKANIAMDMGTPSLSGVDAVDD